MFFPITFPSALGFWLTYKNKSPLKTTSVLDAADFEKQVFIKTAELYQMAFPLHILVPHRSLRNQGMHFKCHVLPENLPKDSFVNMTKDVSIICPELCYLFAAKYLTIPELAVLACDLCGIYAVDAYSRFGQVSREPVTSIARIKDYLSKIRIIPGVDKAKIAIQYALDGSNSPAESRMAVLAIMRYQHGGYGIRKPDLNAIVNLAQEAQNLLGRGECCCDMVWRKERVIVEYDSDMAHNSMEQVHYDKKRITALIMSGYKVITVTPDNFRNFNTADELFAMIRKALGQRENKKALLSGRDMRYDVVKQFFLTFGGLDWFKKFELRAES